MTPQEEPQVEPQVPEQTPEVTATPEAAPEPQQTQASFLDGLKQRGIDLGQDVADDNAAFARLQQVWQQNQELQQIAPYARQYVDNYDSFREFMQSKQKPAKPEVATEKPFYADYWSPPEYNPAWEKMVVRDANGNLAPAPGAPPNIVQKFQEYQSYRQQQMEQFTSNPHEYLKPTIEHLAAEIAKKEIEQHFGQYKDQQFASNFLAQNESWLFKADQGKPVLKPYFNPDTGMMEQRKELSDWGQLMYGYIKEEADWQQKYGVQDVERQQQRAMERVQLAYLADFHSKQQLQAKPEAAPEDAKTPRQKANEKFSKVSVPRARPSANVEPPQQPRKKLADRLKEALAEG